MVDHEIAKAAWALAVSQDNVVARAQLVRLGFSESAITHRVRRGRLRRIHPAVYAVGQAPLTQKGRWRAALLYAGVDSGLCHSSAGALWEVAKERVLVEVIVPNSRRPRAEGITVRRSRQLPPEDITTRKGFRTTTVPRTLIDLAARLTTRSLEPSVNAAVRRRLVSVDELRRAVASRSGLRGAPHLRKLLDASTFRLTDSELERLFLPLAARAGLPTPQTQVALNGFRVDFFWPDLGLVVETDGLAYHWTKEQQRRDRVRDQAHSAAGLHPVRFTHDQVAHDPDAVVLILREVAAKLAAAGSPKAA